MHCFAYYSSLFLEIGIGEKKSHEAEFYEDDYDNDGEKSSAIDRDEALGAK